MSMRDGSHSPEQLAIVRWTAGLGAVTAAALAGHERRTLASSRGLLLSAERAGLLSSSRLLARAPTLYTVTRAGLRAAGVHGLESSRVSVANAPHAIACAEAAVALERAYPDHEVMGERELRCEEREAGKPLASAQIGGAGVPTLHRPDLVLWPDGATTRLPVAVEVELTVKASARLLGICRAWARCSYVAGTLYLTTPEVQRPLARAIDRAQAHEQIVAVSLDALINSEAASSASTPPASTVPSDA
jgi:hypothetical protein